ncbi:MAG: replication initiation protein [Sulfuricurvum sp.]|nr:replication initiation protein [Sulfuricurvum sp.]
MKKQEIIVFTKNEKDEYFRKSTEFASADVTLKEDVKSTGTVERLSATILKGVQDQLFSIARQKQIETISKELVIKYSTEYKDSYISNYIKKAKKSDKSRSLESIEVEAQRNYEIRKKNIDSLAEKKAWRETIITEVKDEELVFRFDARSIFEYAKIHGTKKDRLYDDVKKVQEKFNNWTEKHFNIEKGIIEDIEENGVLFPHSSYKHGADSEIEIVLSRRMIHMVLFLSKNFLKYHLDSYIAVSTPNATRLYEILIDYISGNLFVSGRDLTFEYLQKKFNTNYKQFRLFLRMVIAPSLEKINNELGTNLTWAVDKKRGRNIYSVKFEISDYDRKVLQGIRDENIDDTVLYSFEYFLALVSLGGQKAQGGLRAIYERIRGQVNDGSFEYFGKTREEMFEDHMKNLGDAEELEGLIQNDELLLKKYVYDPVYMNIIDRDELIFIGAIATESLEYLRISYLIPKGILSPTLPYFNSHTEEKDVTNSILPFKFKLTAKKTLIIDNKNFDSMKATIGPYMKSTERFEFDSLEHQERFCEVFGIEFFDNISTAFEAEVVENFINETEILQEHLFDKFESLMLSIGNRSIAKNRDKWLDAVNGLEEEYDTQAVSNVFNFLSNGSDSALFWLKNITTPTKLIQHFEQIEQISNIEELSFMQKVKKDPEIKNLMLLMQSRGESEEYIADEVNRVIASKMERGLYGKSEPAWKMEKRMKRESGEVLMEQIRQAGYTNIFDFIESKE